MHLPNKRVCSSFEKNITSCGKQIGYINEFYFLVFSSHQLANEDGWKELTQYFGINDRFESPVDSRAPRKVIVVTKAVPSFFFLIIKVGSIN